MPSWALQILVGVGATANVAFIVWVATSIMQLKQDMVKNQTELGLIPLSAMIQSQLLNSLHHEDPAYQECDGLIDKFKMTTISPDELVTLRLLLAQRVIDTKVLELERKQAAALLAIMEVVKIQDRDAKAKVMEKIICAIVGLSLASLQTLKYLR
jgi:hypothetical protein